MMDQRSFKSWWRRRLPDISAAASRFPFAVAIAATLTIYKLANDFVGDTELLVLGALAASFLWVVSVDLYIESRRRSSAPERSSGGYIEPRMSSPGTCR